MGRRKDRRGEKAPQGGTAITLGSLTHVGMTRSMNQDAYCALLSPNSPPGTDALLAVADGMGGHLAGDVASTMAIQELVQLLSRQEGEQATLVPPDRYAARLETVVQRVNATVHQAAARPEMRGMGTTLTVALLIGPTAVLAHVGDSRAYLLNKGKLRHLTQDHSWVAEQVAAGVLTPEEAQNHPQRNILTRALGTHPNVQVDTIQATLEEGDRLVLCSDGLHGLVGDEELARVVAQEEPQRACQTLVDRANALGGHDNITVVIARADRLAQGTATAGSSGERHEATTVRLRTPAGGVGAKRKRRRGRLLLRLALAPLWLLAKLLLLLGKLLLRVLIGRRREK